MMSPGCKPACVAGLCGSIYVVCPPMLGEFTPVSQRGAVIAIYGAIYTLAGILAPSVMGSVIQHASGLLEGYMTGFTINAVIMISSGLLDKAIKPLTLSGADDNTATNCSNVLTNSA